MELQIKTDTQNVDWEKVTALLKQASMAFFTAEVHERAFHRSHSVIFVYDGSLLIGMGRAISDGEYQSAIYDVAVSPDYQGKGLGRLIVRHLKEQTPHCNFILYATPGKESFYEKENFRRLKSGMALFVNAERMTEQGFTE